ncbi:MAG: dihydropteroate synthase [Muribaculum sp.]|nr:dihydropteroate synthase [Muribaculum sp.]
MGIINATPDSFYSGARMSTADDIRHRVDEMLKYGADIIDIGGYSSRPGATDISADEELDRLSAAVMPIREIAPHIPVSIDTFRAYVAREAVKTMGADIINDISGGTLDSTMFETIASLRVPYVLTHMRGTPATMQSLTDYSDSRGVTHSVMNSLKQSVDRLSYLGVSDIIIDPGFGFAKTVEQNYTLLADLQLFRVLGKPILAGISRKSMLYKPLQSTPENSLNATTAAHVIALLGGASILRVHDVKAAREALTIVEMTLNANHMSIINQ